MRKYIRFAIIILLCLACMPSFVLALTNAEKDLQDQKIYLMGKFDPSLRKDFMAIPLKYTVVRNKMYLRKETYWAFILMRNSALKDKVNLKIASATRNFEYQKDLWNQKWEGTTIVVGQNLLTTIPDELERFKKILEYSAVPGTSRHHWGADIDINTASPEYFNSEKGAREYDWLVLNAPKFGFCQTYTKKDDKKDNQRKTGYSEEKWHWSYLPISKQLTQDYNNIIIKDDLKEFDGYQYVEKIDLINGYVLSINPECL